MIIAIMMRLKIKTTITNQENPHFWVQDQLPNSKVIQILTLIFNNKEPIPMPQAPS